MITVAIFVLAGAFWGYRIMIGPMTRFFAPVMQYMMMAVVTICCGIVGYWVSLAIGYFLPTHRPEAKRIVLVPFTDMQGTASRYFLVYEKFQSAKYYAFLTKDDSLRRQYWRQPAVYAEVHESVDLQKGLVIYHENCFLDPRFRWFASPVKIGKKGDYREFVVPRGGILRNAD